MIDIVDYGLGNLGSIINMFKRIGVDSRSTSDLDIIKKSTKLILPGVGSFDNAMLKIKESGLLDTLNNRVLIDKVPILGICLGMQLLTRGSEEGKEKGLSWISADTIKFPAINGLKIPHMGWNYVESITESDLTNNLPIDSRYYFVHSYRVKVDSDKNSILKSSYGIKFDAAIQNDNIYGVQFHPEKSHKFGMQLLKNFAEI